MGMMISMTMTLEVSSEFVQNRSDVAMCIFSEKPYMPERPVVKGFRGVDVGCVCFFLLNVYRKTIKEKEEEIVTYIYKVKNPTHPTRFGSFNWPKLTCR